MNRKIISILTLVGIIFFGGLSVLSFLEIIDHNIAEKGVFGVGFSISNYINPQYEYAPPIIRIPDAVSIPINFVFENGTEKSTTFKITGHVELVFKATALSSQNPIKVKATMSFPRLEDQWKQFLLEDAGMPSEGKYMVLNDSLILSEEDLWHKLKLDEQYFLVFPFAQNHPRNQTSNTYFSAMFPIEKNIETKQYLGNGTIMYPFHGDMPFFELFTRNDLLEITEGTTAYIAGSTIDETLQGKPLLIIEPSSVTTILRTNILIIALTSVVISLMIVQLRLQLLKEKIIQDEGNQNMMDKEKIFMKTLDQKIEEERERYKKLKNKYYYLGATFVLLGVGFGIFFSQLNSIPPALSGAAIGLYIGFGISLLMRSVSVNQDRDRSIREIQMDDKLDRILSNKKDEE